MVNRGHAKPALACSMPPSHPSPSNESRRDACPNWATGRLGRVERLMFVGERYQLASAPLRTSQMRCSAPSLGFSLELPNPWAARCLSTPQALPKRRARQFCNLRNLTPLFTGWPWEGLQGPAACSLAPGPQWPGGVKEHRRVFRAVFRLLPVCQRWVCCPHLPFPIFAPFPGVLCRSVNRYGSFNPTFGSHWNPFRAPRHPDPRLPDPPGLGPAWDQASVWFGISPLSLP